LCHARPPPLLVRALLIAPENVHAGLAWLSWSEAASPGGLFRFKKRKPNLLKDRLARGLLEKPL
jgi:hypothetical protein